MTLKLLLVALFAAAPIHVYTQGQVAEPNTSEDKKPTPERVDTPVEKTTGTDEDVKPARVDAATVSKPLDYDYKRPDAKQRFKNYLNNLASPVSLAYYAGTAGLLTLRNSPTEWGDKPDGYARRVANVAAKNAISSTTVYALDEALKVDSTFYRSKDRRFTARLRNSVFSAVTARDKKGKRVIGIPVIAGGMLSEVVSSTAWYPSRFDYVHGLKGGAISIGITTGLNLFKEFVWKPGRK